MNKIPVHNNSAMTMYVHGVMIPAGETRHFDENDVPPEYRPVADAAPAASELPEDALPALLDENVHTIVAKLGELSDGDISRLLELEEVGKARKTLIEQLNATLAFRTLDFAVTAMLAGSADVVIATLHAMSDEELARVPELEADGANREAVLTAAAAEQLKRSE